MSWVPFLTQLLQTISVGTIATALYAVAKWLKSALDRKPLFFGVVRASDMRSWTTLEVTVRNRSLSDLYVDTIALVDAGRATLHTRDGGAPKRAVIDAILAPCLPTGQEIPTLGFHVGVRDLAPDCKLVQLEISVVFSRQWFARRRYRFSAALTDQRRNLSIKI